MIQLNKVGIDALRSAGGASALTDITGYGLAGHAGEMAEAARLTFELDVRAIPIIEGTEALAVPRFFTRASKSNREFLEGRLRVEPGVDPQRIEFAFDAQTSGGLLIAVEPDRAEFLLQQLRDHGASAAALVGRVLEREGQTAIVLR
jgi:selenide,water dikinase